MALTIPKFSPGDVISLAVPPGVGIVQFTGVDAGTAVSTIRVVPGVFGAIPHDVERHLTERSYFTLCPIEEALKDRSGKVVGSFAVSTSFPADYRRPALHPREWMISAEIGRSSPEN